MQEIHITVQTDDVEDFKKACADLGVKPIVIAFDAGGKEVRDVMTSSVIKGDRNAAFTHASYLSHSLRRRGFAVIRQKNEEPLSNHNILGIGGYFEGHLSYTVADAVAPYFRDAVRNINSLHASRNPFKVLPGKSVMMTTLRHHGADWRDFKASMLLAEMRMVRKGWRATKAIHEYCWYDSNVEHDGAWLGTSPAGASA